MSKDKSMGDKLEEFGRILLNNCADALQEAGAPVQAAAIRENMAGGIRGALACMDLAALSPAPDLPDAGGDCFN